MNKTKNHDEISLIFTAGMDIFGSFQSNGSVQSLYIRGKERERDSKS